jgi:acyl carrier protein
MTYEELRQITEELISEYFEVDIAELECAEDLVKVLDLNSLTRMEMLVVLKLKVGVSIPISDFVCIRTLKDLVDYLYTHQNKE